MPALFLLLGPKTYSGGRRAFQQQSGEEKIEKISGKKFNKNYQLDKPKGVAGRNSDNTLIRKQLSWEPKYSLYAGLEKTYEWISSEIKKKHNQLNK